MKWLKVFSLFVIIHSSAWATAHWYRSANPSTVLVIVDTSFSLKPHFVDMQRWIEAYSSSGRYQKILVGTDKAMIGELSGIRSNESIFRAAFGRSSLASLKKYDSVDADKRILLSDGEIDPAGWSLVTF